ncbi:MAG: YgfZ/GcvT domain-containing protein [Solirubrobacterales bacterium]
MESAAPEIDDQYRQVREGVGQITLDRAWIEVSGPDAAEYLQSQVTNDVESLEVGSSTYAALLDRKGRIQADMRITGIDPGRFLIDCEPSAGEGLVSHLDTYRIGRDVEVDLVERSAIALLGPAAFDLPTAPQGIEGMAGVMTVGEHECLALVTRWGIDLVVPDTAPGEVEAVLDGLGVGPVNAETGEILRVEAGRPRMGREIESQTMPAEAGIVERAVSFEKGCYIGQEPVARLHYKGKPNRFLRGLRFADRVPAGSVLTDGERELGKVTTVVRSPAEGWIGLAVVRREASPGDLVEASTDTGPVETKVVELPFPAAGEDPS